MDFDRDFSQVQFAADFLVAFARRHSLQYFDLSSAQRFTADAVSQFRSQGGWYAGLTSVDFANAFHQSFTRSVFQKVCLRARFDRAINVLITIERGENKNNRVVSDDLENKYGKLYEDTVVNPFAIFNRKERYST